MANSPPKKAAAIKIALALLKTTVTLGLLAWVFTKIEFDVINHKLNNIQIHHLIIAVFLHGFALFLFSIRWYCLLKILQPSCTYKQIFGAYYLGLFWNNLLPSAIGGDVVRILKLRGTQINTKKLVMSTLIDRYIGLASIAILGITAITFMPTLNLSQDSKSALLALFIFAIGGVLFIASNRGINLVFRIGQMAKHIQAIKSTLIFLTTLKKYTRNKNKLIHAVFYSFIAQFFIILCYVFIGLCLNLTIPYYMFFSIIPVVFLASAIPISIGGMGIRETILIGLLGLYSVDMQQSIAISIIYISILIALTLPGVFYMNNFKSKSLPE